MDPTQSKPSPTVAKCLSCCALLFGTFVQLHGQSIDEAMDQAAQSALDRVALDADQRGVKDRAPAEAVRVRRRSSIGAVDPIYRSGVAYFDEWNIRAGALKLRVPAYYGWKGVRASSDFYDIQANSGVPGEHLALAITNEGFVRSTRSKFVNNYGLIWVPQEFAFTSMTETSFSDVKESVRSFVVADRKSRSARSDFAEFEDYVAFKAGADENVAEFQDGFWIRAIDEPDMVTYYSTSEFVFQTPRQEIRQPMIMTVTYALVRGKLLRFDFKRLYLSDEDAIQLITFTQRFVSDMRTVNGLSERKIR